MYLKNSLNYVMFVCRHGLKVVTPEETLTLMASSSAEKVSLNNKQRLCLFPFLFFFIYQTSNLLILRLSGSVPSTRRWIRLWTERHRTPAALGRRRSLRSPGRLPTPSIKTGGWRTPRTRDVGWLGSLTAGRSPFGLKETKQSLISLICCFCFQGYFKMAWWEDLHGIF